METTPKPGQAGLEKCGVHRKGKALSPATLHLRRKSFLLVPGSGWWAQNTQRLKAWGEWGEGEGWLLCSRGLGNGCCWGWVGGGGPVPSRGSWVGASGNGEQKSTGPEHPRTPKFWVVARESGRVLTWAKSSACAHSHSASHVPPWGSPRQSVAPAQPRVAPQRGCHCM